MIESTTLESTRQCPECGAHNFYVNKEKGEVICRVCSFVLEDAMMDFGRERIIDSEDFSNKTRSGAPFDPRISDNLITEVGSKDDLRRLPAKTRQVMERIRKKNKWVSSGLQQNLNANLTNLKLVASYLNLPERVEKEAARIYRESVAKGLTMARSNDNIIAGSVYASSKLHSMPKSLNEVSEATKIDKFTIARTYKLILKRLNIKPVMTISNPVDFVGRFSSDLGLDAKIQTKTVKMIEKMQKMGLNSGKSPISLAATALYITTLTEKTKVTQKRIAEVSGITETTLRNRTNEMILKLKIKKSELKKKKA